MSINPSDLTAAPWHWGKECKYLHTALKNKKKEENKKRKGCGRQQREPRLPGRGPGAHADVWHRGSKTGFLHSCCLTASSWVRAPGKGLKSESLTHCPYLEVPELSGALSSGVGWLLFQQQLRVCAGFGSVTAETPPRALQASRAV